MFSISYIDPLKPFFEILSISCKVRSNQLVFVLFSWLLSVLLQSSLNPLRPPFLKFLFMLSSSYNSPQCLYLNSFPLAAKSTQISWVCVLFSWLNNNALFLQLLKHLFDLLTSINFLAFWELTARFPGPLLKKFHHRYMGCWFPTPYPASSGSVSFCPEFGTSRLNNCYKSKYCLIEWNWTQLNKVPLSQGIVFPSQWITS